VADCIAADELLDQLLTAEVVHGDKGYDSDAVRRKVESKGAAPNIPPKANRRWKNCFSPWLYRHRNAIERMFGRLKDFRRIATRYDRLSRNFLAAVCLAATLCYWLVVWTLMRQPLRCFASYDFSKARRKLFATIWFAENWKLLR
jgi:transposase